MKVRDESRVTPSRVSVSDNGMIASQTLIEEKQDRFEKRSRWRVENRMAADLVGFTERPLEASQRQS